MNLLLAGVGAFVLLVTPPGATGTTRVAGAPPRAPTQDDLLFGEIAQRWLQRQELPAADDWRALLEQRFTHLSVGVFDVYLPANALRDTRALKDAGTALAALVETQDGWRAWVAGTSVEARRGKDDVLLKWLKGLSPRGLQGKDLHGADLAAGADEGVKSALAALRQEMRAGPALGSPKELAGVRLVIFPQRAEFVEFTCVAGLLDGYLTPSAWQDGLTTWLEYQAAETRFVALEYGASENGRDFEKGIGVGERNPAALSQLVSQVSSRALIEQVFSVGLDPALRSGMANALVIDLYGELDTRIDGDVRSRSSQGRSVFVPGGNPDGGILPPTSAENRWRGTRGRDHFTRILAQVQKQSGKKAATRPEKLARFELQSDDGGQREVVHGPFLGPQAVKPGAAFLPDYLEFVRCYGVAFLHWLRLEGAQEESPARFAEFLRRLAQGVETEDLPRVFQEVYRQPVSGESLIELFEEPTLEGRFLAWLAKQA